jgi:hypothetical protein
MSIKGIIECEVVVWMKLCGGCCACADVMLKFCSKFTKIINIQISFFNCYLGTYFTMYNH